MARNPLPIVRLGDFPSRRRDPGATRRHRLPRIAVAGKGGPTSAGPSLTCSVSMPTDPIPGSTASASFPVLDGCKIVALSAEGALLETSGGVRQSYRRKAGRPGRVLVWKVGS